VPHHRALAGPLLQALAFETLLQERVLRQVSGGTVLLASMLLTLLSGSWFLRLPWRRSLLVLGSAGGGRPEAAPRHS
jgi:hypothetical protein